jgi:hypothetical protein
MLDNTRNLTCPIAGDLHLFLHTSRGKFAMHCLGNLESQETGTERDNKEPENLGNVGIVLRIGHMATSVLLCRESSMLYKCKQVLRKMRETSCHHNLLLLLFLYSQRMN